MNSNKKKIIYSVLREIERGEYLPKFSDYGLSLLEFRDLIDLIQDDDLIKGASLPRGQQRTPEQMILLDTAEITLKGSNYLKDNSSYEETYPGLKQVKPWLRH